MSGAKKRAVSCKCQELFVVAVDVATTYAGIL